MTSGWNEVRASLEVDEAEVARHRDELLDEVGGVSLQSIRENLGMSREEMAARLGIDVSVVEQGEDEPGAMSIAFLDAYVTALGGDLEIGMKLDGTYLPFK